MRTAILLLLVALAFAACSNDGRSSSEATPTASRASGPTATNGPDDGSEPDPIGKLIEPHHDVVQVTREGEAFDVAPDVNLLERDDVSTMVEGTATALLQDLAVCTLESESAATLLPDGAGGPTHHLESGSVTCTTIGGNHGPVTSATGTFRPSGTTFRTSLDDEENFTVRVYQGSGTLESATGTEVILLAGQKASVTEGGAVLVGPEPFQLSAQELATLRGLAEAIESQDIDGASDPLSDAAALSLALNAGTSSEVLEAGIELTFGADDVPNAVYVWDFGDGTKVEAEAETVHLYEEAGEYEVVVTIETEEGLRGEATFLLQLDEASVQ